MPLRNPDAHSVPVASAAGTASHAPELTGLRGLAAGWVMVFHLWQFCGRPALVVAGMDFSPLLAGGHYGVDLFFVLSGFLLARPFIHARLRGDPAPAPGAFLLRRMRRVLPAYWLQLVILVALGGLASRSLLELITHATLSFNLIDNGSKINPVYWSLPVEWNFYLLLPLFALALPGPGRRPWLVPAAIVFAFGFRVLCWQALFWTPPDVALFRWIIQLPARLDQFVIGLAVAWWLAARPLPSPTWRQLAAVGGLLLLVATAWITVLHGDELTRARLPWAYVQAPLAALGCAGLILAAATGSDGLTRLWRTRVFLFLGSVSYSLYLWHYPVMVWLNGALPQRAMFGFAAVALSLLIAWVSWRWVEQPFLRRRSGTA